MIARNRALAAVAVVTVLGAIVPGPASPFANRRQAAPAKEAPHSYDAAIATTRAEIVKAIDENKIPGVAVAVVTDREVLWTEGFGFTDVDRKTPVTPETLFSIQSMSKNFTAAAVLAAARDGLVDLDAPITAYMPGFTVHSRFEERPERKITLRILLSHRAGFTHEAPVGGNYGPGGFREHVESISRTWLRFPVDERYAYSNLGIDLAAWILQLRSGMPFPEYVRKTVLEPLGMKATTFEIGRIMADRTRAVGHSRSAGPVPVEVPMLGAGGCYASAAELARYVRWHLNGGAVDGKPLIPDALYRQMAEIPGRGARQEDGYGLGLAVEHHHGRLQLNHGGGGFGFLTHMLWYPDWKVGVVLLTNTAAHRLFPDFSQRILDRFTEARVGALPADPVAPVDPSLVPEAVAPERLAALAGRYLYAGGSEVIVRLKDGRLEMGEEKSPEPFTFYGGNGEAWVERKGSVGYYRFVTGKDGRPAVLIQERDGTWLDHESGPSDPAGPDKPEWDRWLGTYRIIAFGIPADALTVARKAGYLYLDDLRLAEYEPGLFFTAHGQAVDFRGNPPTWRNIPLTKVPFQAPPPPLKKRP